MITGMLLGPIQLETTRLEVYYEETKDAIISGLYVVFIFLWNTREGMWAGEAVFEGN